MSQKEFIIKIEEKTKCTGSSEETHQSGPTPTETNSKYLGIRMRSDY